MSIHRELSEMQFGPHSIKCTKQIVTVCPKFPFSYFFFNGHINNNLNVSIPKTSKSSQNKCLHLWESTDWLSNTN